MSAGSRDCKGCALMACRVLANVLFPNWLVTMMLLGLLLFLTYKTGRKAISLHRCEVRYLAQREERASGNTGGQGGQGSEKTKARKGPAPADAGKVSKPLSHATVIYSICADAPTEAGQVC